MSPELISILALVALFVVGTVLPIKWPFGAHQPNHWRHVSGTLLGPCRRWRGPHGDGAHSPADS
jgi:hypothetical protein